MTFKSEIGKLGEDLACEYLVKQNYKVIERNFRKPWGELDIIAMAPDKTLVFVEVKTMKKSGLAAQDLAQRDNPAINSATCGEHCRTIAGLTPHINLCEGLNPEDNLTAAKLRKLQRTAASYVSFNENLINSKKGWRIDLIAIALENGKEPEIKHFENI